MNFSNVQSVVIPEGSCTKIAINGQIVWQAVTIKNWVRYSTEADGTTIYNNGLGYKIGYRISSSGTEKVNSASLVTGFIPFKSGDVLRISPQFTGKNTENSIAFSDSSHTQIGQFTDSGAGYGICTSSIYKSTVVDGVSTLTYTNDFNSNIAYVRITHFLESTDGTDLIITINEPI